MEPKGSPHLKDVGTDSETERRLSCQAAQPPSGAQGFRAPRAPRAPARTSGRRGPTASSDASAALTRQAHFPPVTGRLHPRRQITVKPTPSLPPPVPPAGLGLGVGEKASPGGNSRPRLPEPRAPIGTRPPLRRGREQHCYHRDAQSRNLGTRRGGASSGPGARAGGRGRAKGAAGPSLAPSRESQAVNLTPRRSWSLAPAHGPTHNSLISTIFPESPHSCCRYRRRYRRSRRLRGTASLPTESPRRLRVHTLPPRAVASARQRGGLRPSSAPHPGHPGPSLGLRGRRGGVRLPLQLRTLRAVARRSQRLLPPAKRPRGVCATSAPWRGSRRSLESLSGDWRYTLSRLWRGSPPF